MKSPAKKEGDKKPKPLAVRTQAQREEALSCLKELKEEYLKKAEAADKKAKEDALRNLQPGQLVSGKGVFIGIWQPKDREGNSLGRIFNVFAAPQDLTDASGQKNPLTYEDTVNRVAELKNWHGHDGGRFINDTAVYDALKNNSYNGEWFIPTRDLLDGKEFNKKTVQLDNLYRYKDTGALKGTFTTTVGFYPHWYWSCTESAGVPIYMWEVRFTDGADGLCHMRNGGQSCRPVRVEPRPSM